MKHITINIDWNSEKSIELAELQKENLKNEGYHQIGNTGGMNYTALIYGKETR